MSAIVVGPQGESRPNGADEIWCDRLGRIKVRFHWQTGNTPDDCTSCWVRVATRQLESGDVCVSVSDTGKGIMSDEQEYLFNPFYTTKQDGLGLGLVICRSFVENHGGRIWADARREMGAEFSFTLPASICQLNRDEVPV